MSTTICQKCGKLDNYGYVPVCTKCFDKDEALKEDIRSAVEWLDKKVSMNWGLPEHGKRTVRRFIKEAFGCDER